MSNDTRVNMDLVWLFFESMPQVSKVRNCAQQLELQDGQPYYSYKASLLMVVRGIECIMYVEVDADSIKRWVDAMETTAKIWAQQQKIL